MKIFLIVIAAALAVFALLLALAYVAYRFAFWKRSDRNPRLKYFSAEDFNLTAENIEVGRLRGAVYTKDAEEKKNAVIVFVHGMGPGHVAYTTEIAGFCNLGYTVVALDSLGCGFSGGNKMRGMYEGVKTAVAAIDFTRARFPESEVYLVGHSWGGYSALCAAKIRKVEKAVAISAPDSPAKTLYYGAAGLMPKPIAAILYPFWGIINFLLFGAKGNLSAAKCAVKIGTPVLLIQGGDDTVVAAKNAAYVRANGKNITKYYAHGKGHNPYNTVAAEAKLAELMCSLKKGVTDFSGFDFAAATEEDEEVMRAIADFLN